MAIEPLRNFGDIAQPRNEKIGTVAVWEISPLNRVLIVRYVDYAAKESVLVVSHQEQCYYSVGPFKNQQAFNCYVVPRSISFQSKDFFVINEEAPFHIVHKHGRLEIVKKKKKEETGLIEISKEYEKTEPADEKVKISKQMEYEKTELILKKAETRLGQYCKMHEISQEDVTAYFYFQAWLVFHDASKQTIELIDMKNNVHVFTQHNIPAVDQLRLTPPWILYSTPAKHEGEHDLFVLNFQRRKGKFQCLLQ